MAVLRHLDLVLLALALPLFIAAGWPLLGYGAGAFAWLAQKAIKAWLERKAATAETPRAIAGILTGSMIGRGWLVAITIFAAGVGSGDDAVGLGAAVLVISLFTVYFTVALIMRPFAASPEEPSS
jgi:hypothetical protein